MTSMPIKAARDDLSGVVNRVVYGRERICLTRYGKDVACVVSVEEAKLLEDRLDLSDALAAVRDSSEQGPVP